MNNGRATFGTTIVFFETIGSEGNYQMPTMLCDLKANEKNRRSNLMPRLCTARNHQSDDLKATHNTEEVFPMQKLQVQNI